MIRIRAPYRRRARVALIAHPAASPYDRKLAATLTSFDGRTVSIVLRFNWIVDEDIATERAGYIAVEC